MTKVVINTCYGGFGLSEAARKIIAEAGWERYIYCIDRDNAALVEAVETLGDAANGPYAKLKVVEIPDDVDWMIQEYDGDEWVAEVHRTWGAE